MRQYACGAWFSVQNGTSASRHSPYLITVRLSVQGHETSLNLRQTALVRATFQSLWGGGGGTSTIVLNVHTCVL